MNMEQSLSERLKELKEKQEKAELAKNNESDMYEEIEENSDITDIDDDNIVIDDNADEDYELSEDDINKMFMEMDEPDSNEIDEETEHKLAEAVETINSGKAAQQKPTFSVNVKKNQPSQDYDQSESSFDDTLFEDSLPLIEKENDEIAKQLKEMMSVNAIHDAESKEEILNSSEEIIEYTQTDKADPTDDIDDLLARFENANESNENKENENLSIEDFINEYYTNISHVEIESNEKITGPSRYMIEPCEEYAESVEDILASNNITIVKKNQKEKDAILDRFANSGNSVSTVLVNSGIFITVSGAGTGEVMAMNKPDKTNKMRTEMDKLLHVCNHITGSSIGRMKLSQLVKVVSYYDLDQLYYALYAATYPEKSSFTLTCPHCNKRYYVDINTTDFLLNSDSFTDTAEDIKDNVTTYNRLLETSKVGTLYKKAYGNNLIIWFRHPTIENYLSIKNNLNEDIYNKYVDYIAGDQLIFCIAKVAIRVDGNKFIEITDPNEIISKVISQLKDPSQKYEIYKMSTALVPKEIPSFGIKKHYCPYCSKEIDAINTSMDQMLFTVAKEKEEIAQLKWVQSMERDEKMKKNKMDTKK